VELLLYVYAGCILKAKFGVIRKITPIARNNKPYLCCCMCAIELITLIILMRCASSGQRVILVIGAHMEPVVLSSDGSENSRSTVCKMRVNPVPFLALLALLNACTTSVTPPAGLTQAVSVYIVDHGRHSSLVIPGETGWQRYAYGDWRWYAEGETGLLQGAAALFWPTPAGLGRQRLAQLPDLTPALNVGFESLHEIRVEATSAAALASRLAALHEREEARRRFNSLYRLEFAAHPERYWVFNQSNGKVAEWLREMGCEVSRTALLARWRVNE